MNTPTPHANSARAFDFSGVDLGRAIDRAVAEEMNAVAPDLPPLNWGIMFLDGVPPMLTAAADEGALDLWADRFGMHLHPTERTAAGVRDMRCTATIDGSTYKIRVHAIVDRATYIAWCQRHTS
ncbi:hypothetical protein [Nocardia wallacei]|uniref:hypothetical protein n=1 Tax=Nocardia wallacei TaxID=480035 RepID=UPI0024588AD4|nr:hypothetical protein [Nocardia wallacei]